MSCANCVLLEKQKEKIKGKTVYNCNHLTVILPPYRVTLSHAKTMACGNWKKRKLSLKDSILIFLA